MKAIVTTNYGTPDVLELKEIKKPIPKDNEVLIKMHAATVTAGDCELRRFDIPLPVIFWLPLRIIMGILRPKKNLVQGQEMAGEIVELGKDVENFNIGDQVFGGSGMRFGAYAEYKLHRAVYPMALKPAGISYEAAVTLTVGGQNALHFLRLANIQPGQKVLVYGATGSIGTYAVQLAQYYGAEVTAVCSTPNLEYVKSFGADKSIDYTKQDFTTNGESYDIIFEAVGKSSFSQGLKSLKKNGIYILSNPKLLQMMRAPWISWFSSKKVIFAFAGEKTEDLNYLAKLMEEGKIKSIIDRRYPLEETAEAHRYVEIGQKTGHVVINISD